MHTTLAISSLLFAASSLAQVAIPGVSADAIESEILRVESAIESYLPGGIPSKSAIAEDLASFVTSVTAQPEFSNAVSVLGTAVPSAVVDAVSADPQGLIMSLATASSPAAWIEAIPTSVINYVSSIGAEAVSLVEAELPTGDLKYGYRGSRPSGSAVYPTGTAVYPIGTAVYPTGTAVYPSGSGYAQPTGGNSTGPSIGTPSPYQGSASSYRLSAMAAAAGLVGAGLMFFA